MSPSLAGCFLCLPSLSLSLSFFLKSSGRIHWEFPDGSELSLSRAQVPSLVGKLSFRKLRDQKKKVSLSKTCLNLTLLQSTL